MFIIDPQDARILLHDLERNEADTIQAIKDFLRLVYSRGPVVEEVVDLSREDDDDARDALEAAISDLRSARFAIIEDDDIGGVEFAIDNAISELETALDNIETRRNA